VAVDWFVPDVASAKALDAALASGWPGSPVEVRVAGPSGRGVWVETGELVYIEGDLERRVDAGDLETQVLLVRSWSRDLVVEDMGWAPSVALETVVLPGDEAPDEGLWMSVSAGGGARFPDLGTLASADFEAGLRWRSVRGGGRVGVSALESLPARGAAVNVRRPYALAVAWARIPMGDWEGGVGLGSGVRLGELRSAGTSSWFWTLAAEAGIRVVAGRGSVRPGLGFTVSHDTAQRAWLADGRSVAERQTAATAEFVALWDRK